MAHDVDCDWNDSCNETFFAMNFLLGTVHLIAVCSELRAVCCTYAPSTSTCASIIHISVKTFPLVPLSVVGP
jgi:hypothetical protein